MALLDIYQVNMVTQILDQSCLNVFFYQETTEGETVPNHADLLAQEFVARHFSDPTSLFTSSLFSDQVRYMSAVVINLFDPADVGEELDGTKTGANADTLMPTFCAFSLRTNWTTRLIRRGQKRFPGVVENANVNGEIIASAMTQLAQLGDQLAETLVWEGISGNLVWTPVVVKRIREETPTRVTYRLPTNLQEAVWVGATSWTPSNRITTQNSRKIGRGQ